jgi:hypothetical protein
VVLLRQICFYKFLFLKISFTIIFLFFHLPLNHKVVDCLTLRYIYVYNKHLVCVDTQYSQIFSCSFTLNSCVQTVIKIQLYTLLKEFCCLFKIKQEIPYQFFTDFVINTRYQNYSAQYCKLLVNIPYGH